MGEALLIRKGGGGLEINGLVEEYKVLAGENISAGDFVEFITDYTSGRQTLTSSAYNNRVSAVMLTPTTVFVAFSYGTSWYLYGVVCTIVGSTLSVGAVKSIDTTTLLRNFG